MVLGVDLGGSSIKVVRFADGACEPLGRIPHGARGAPAVLGALLDAIPRTGEPVGLAVCGLVRGGSVVRSGNLDLRDAPLVALLEERGVKLAAFLSDARAVGLAALREEGEEPIRIALALGTGVGGTLIEGGRIVLDEGLGHGTLVPEPASAPCAIGHPSCLEAHLGAAALARALGVASPLEVDRRAEAGDAAARKLLHAAGALAGRALASRARGLRARLVVSGGVASSRALLEGLRSSAPGPVVLSRFEGYTAAVGAALACQA